MSTQEDTSASKTSSDAPADQLPPGPVSEPETAEQESPESTSAHDDNDCAEASVDETEGDEPESPADGPQSSAPGAAEPPAGARWDQLESAWGPVDPAAWAEPASAEPEVAETLAAEPPAAAAEVEAVPAEPELPAAAPESAPADAVVSRPAEPEADEPDPAEPDPAEPDPAEPDPAEPGPAEPPTVAVKTLPPEPAEPPTVAVKALKPEPREPQAVGVPTFTPRRAETVGIEVISAAPAAAATAEPGEALPPEPEPVRRPPATAAPFRVPPLLGGLVSLTTGIGLLLEGMAMAIAPKNNGEGQLLFWVGMIVPFGIYLGVLMKPRLGRLRGIVIAIIGLYPSLVFRMSSILVLGGFDEHLHDQELRNLLDGSGLFAPNPILRAGPYYPGLELFTGVLTRLSGMPVLLSESVAVLIARLLLVLLLYQGAHLVSPSRRGASLVVAFYAVGQQFYAFNSQFAYQTLAVTLGLGGLVLLRRAQLAERDRVPLTFWVAVAALMATVITHHVSGVLTLCFLFAWTWATPKSRRKLLRRASLYAGIFGLLWTGALLTHLLSYFGPIVLSVIQEAQSFLNGTGGTKAFTASSGAPPNPAWERYMLYAYELGCCGAAVTCAWVMLPRARRNRDRMLGLLGLLDLSFPLTAAAHFDPSVGAIGDRLSTFLFFPLALSFSLVLRRDPWVAKPGRPPRNLFRPALLRILVLGTTFIYLGGTLLGSAGDWSRLPGPYLVSADSRSQDPYTLAAIEWVAEHIPPGSTITSDRVPGALMTGQARMWSLGAPQGNLLPSQLYFSPTWDFQDGVIVKGMHIDYIYVDKRMTESLPYEGFYVSVGETHTPTRMTAQMVDKFARVKGLKVVYQRGPVTIYNTAGLGVVLERHGFTGYRTMGAGPYDAAIGALVALLAALFLRRRWARTLVRESGSVGTATGAAVAAIFLGALLFGLRVMPGPAFSAGALGAAVVIGAVLRRRAGRPVVPPVRVRAGLIWLLRNWLVILGVAAGLAGLAICLQSAWVYDVHDVAVILGSGS